MKKYVYLFIGCWVAILMASCDNYLDVKPKGKIIPVTAEDFSTIIHYWIDEIEKGRDDVIVPQCEKILALEMFADDLNGTLASNYIPGVYVGTAINTNQSDYKTLFGVIKDCNMIIGHMEDTESELSRVLLGTAWGIRTICYYNLMQRYCEPYDPVKAGQTLGLPLVNEFDMEAKPARSTLAETATFIKEGFRKAISYQMKNEDFLFTVPVIKAYAARFYFWIQEWNQATAFAKEALDEYPMLEAEEYVEGINQKTSKMHNVIVRSMTEDDEIGIMSYSVAQADIKSRPADKNLVNLFDIQPNDVRAQCNYDGKRLATKMVTGKFRSEELCLILAESYAHLQKEPEALYYLNLLRSKRITKDYTPYTMENLPDVYAQHIQTDATGKPLTRLMSAILCERRKELFLEGDRWFELKRNGRPTFWVAANGKKYVTEPYLYTFPLPKADVRLFPGLIVQNPGYLE